MIDVYEMVNERILALLDQGVSPWRKPWAAAAQRPPQNLLSRKPYRGVNTLLLGLAPYESPYWLTFRQARQCGGTVRKGEKASIAVFWNILDRPDESNPDKERHIPLVRYYSVFNAEQCDGVAAPKTEVATYDHDPVAQAEAIVTAMPNAPRILHEDRRRAFYRLSDDTVNMPPLSRFPKTEEYHSVLFHELTHATGHTSRLNREMSGSFGSASYGREELIAEMGAAYLCGLAGILDTTGENTAAYLDTWRRTIKADKRAIVVAAGAAQKAVDFITGRLGLQEEQNAA